MSAWTTITTTHWGVSRLATAPEHTHFLNLPTVSINLLNRLQSVLIYLATAPEHTHFLNLPMVSINLLKWLQGSLIAIAINTHSMQFTDHLN